MTPGKIIASLIKTLLPAAVVVAVWVIYIQSNFMAYLKIHRRNRWDEITSFMGVSGGRNSFKAIPYFFDSRDIDDIRILNSKKKMRYGIFIFLVLVVCLFSIFAILTTFFQGRNIR